MRWISHRGNLTQINTSAENHPEYIDAAIRAGFEVEVDVRYFQGQWFLGHDNPQYLITDQWLADRITHLWIHCKNIEAVCQFQHTLGFHYFWHEHDTMTLTSLGYIWVYPGRQPIRGSIAVLPEWYHDDISHCIGICSDLIAQYRK